MSQLASWWRGTDAEAREFERQVLDGFKQAVASAPELTERQPEIKLVGEYPDTELRISFAAEDRRFRSRSYAIWGGHSEWGHQSADYTAGSMYIDMRSSRS